MSDQELEVSETPSEWPDGKVATSKPKSRSGGSCKFHTEECVMIPDEPSFMRYGVCMAWDNFRECKYCTGEADLDEMGSGSPYE